MRNTFKEVMDQVIKFNDYLDNKVIPKRGALKEQEAWNTYFDKINTINKLLDKIKKIPVGNIEENRSILVDMVVNIGILTGYLDNLEDNLNDIIKEYKE